MASTASALGKMSRSANRAIESLPKPEPAAKAEPAKTTKKATAAKKSAKTLAPKASGARTKYAPEAVIKVLNPEHGMKGDRGKGADALKSGITVLQYRAQLEKIGLTGYPRWELRKALTEKRITLTMPKAA